MNNHIHFRNAAARFLKREYKKPEPVISESEPATPEPEPPAPPDPIGHQAWSAEQGISPTTGLLLCANTLAHIAGPSLLFENVNGLRGLPPPSLLGAESDVLLTAALARLTSNLVSVQTRLLLGSQEFARAEVDQCFHAIPLSGNAMSQELEKFQPPTPGKAVEALPENSLHAMLSIGDRSIHRENILHPLFLVQSAPPGPLDQFLANCHHGHCFVAGGTENLPVDKNSRHRRLDELIRYIDGTVIQLRQPSGTRVKTAALRGLFLFRQPDIHWLLDHRRDVMRKLIAVSSNPPPADEPFEYDPEGAQGFLKRFSKTAHHVLARRRAFAGNGTGFTDEDARHHFMIRRRQHLIQCANHPTDLSTLPDLLAWTLLILGYGRAEEHVLVDIAMEAVETLRQETARTFLLHDDMALGLQRLQNAMKMLRRLAEQGPQKRHELVRVFAKQRIGLHAPVIDCLLTHGFLTEDPDKRLHLGALPASKLTVDHLLEPQKPQIEP